MILKYLITALLALSALQSLAQQESQFANVANNPFYVNPAAAGLYDVMQFEATYRSQWMGYNGGPRTMMFMGNSQIGGKSKKALKEFNIKDESFFGLPERSTGSIKHIVGGKMMNDAIGPFARTSVHGSYAIHLPFVSSFNFGAGLGIGWSNFKVDESRVLLHQTDDVSYSQFLGNTSTQNMLDVNAGLVFYNDVFFMGLSTTQALNNKLRFDAVDTESAHVRHYYVVSKYKFNLGSVALEPSITGKLAPKGPVSIDLGTRLIINNSTWLGIQYRTSNALIFQVGSTIIKNLYVGYSYEQAIGSIKTVNNGSHEIQLGLLIGNNRNIDKEIKESKAEDDTQTIEKVEN